MKKFVFVLAFALVAVPFTFASANPTSQDTSATSKKKSKKGSKKGKKKDTGSTSKL